MSWNKVSETQAMKKRLRDGGDGKFVVAFRVQYPLWHQFFFFFFFFHGSQDTIPGLRMYDGW